MKVQKSPPPSGALIGPNRCPVCGHVAYSAAGIHPQCAQKRADGENKKALLALATPGDLKPKNSPWSKPRPK